MEKIAVYIKFNPFVALLIGVVLLVSACTTSHISYDQTYWPKPPDPPRFVFEGTLRSSEDIVAFTTSSQMRAALTGFTGNNMAFNKPYDVAAYGGKLVISDTMAGHASIWDIPRKKVYFFGKRKEGAILKPGGVGMDARQWIYVADLGDKRVKVYDNLGLFIRQIGDHQDYQKPLDVAANKDGSRIYVVDGGGIDNPVHQVVIFDAEGNKLKSIGKRGSDIGDFNLPIQAAVARDGTLYVLDSGNFRVQAFDPDGNYLRSWGKVGRNFGDFARPRGIAVDQQGNVYVSDSAYRNFQVFTPEGVLLLAIGGEGFEDLPGQFALPAGIAVDETNRVYVVGQMLKKVDIMRKLNDIEISAITAKRNNGDAKNNVVIE